MKDKDSQAPARRDFLLEAAQLLDLSAEERQLLRRIAARTSISPPAAMLLTPANFAHAVQGGLRTEELRAARDQLNKLCEKLFDVELPDPADQYLNGD